MAIKFKKVDYEVAPAGLHQAVCVDVVDLGIVDTSFGPRVMIKIVWQLVEENKKGFRFLVSQRYNPSKSKKGNLRQMLETWRSKPFNDAEIGDFDIESLVGVNCQVSIAHNITEGGTWANVKSVVPAPRGGIKVYAQDYTREINRPDYRAPEQPVEEPEIDERSQDVGDEDIPF